MFKPISLYRQRNRQKESSRFKLKKFQERNVFLITILCHLNFPSEDHKMTLIKKEFEKQQSMKSLFHKEGMTRSSREI